MNRWCTADAGVGGRRRLLVLRLQTHRLAGGQLAQSVPLPNMNENTYINNA